MWQVLEFYSISTDAKQLKALKAGQAKATRAESSAHAVPKARNSWDKKRLKFHEIPI